MLYIPINTHYHTFALGAFRTEKEAQDAFYEYLTQHENFEQWLTKVKVAYNTEFGRPLSDLRVSLFDMDDVDFWSGEYNLACTIEGVKYGEMIEFYQWSSWIEREPCSPPERNNLYYVVTACHENKPYALSDVTDIRTYLEHYPLI